MTTAVYLYIATAGSFSSMYFINVSDERLQKYWPNFRKRRTESASNGLDIGKDLLKELGDEGKSMESTFKEGGDAMKREGEEHVGE